EGAPAAGARRAGLESGPDLRPPAQARPGYARTARGPRQGKSTLDPALIQIRLTAAERAPIVRHTLPRDAFPPSSDPPAPSERIFVLREIVISGYLRP